MFHSITLICSTLISLIFTQMSHPLAMGLILLVQTLCICLLTGFMTQSFWFSYILFLVFLGGLLVLFIYVTSLASNEMFSLSTATLSTMIILFGISGWLALAIDPLFYLTNCLNTDMMEGFTMNLYGEEASLSLTKLYNQPTGLITLMLVLYLFLTLIAVVKITCIFFGPLRQKN
uniref:NADH-ubiquinone oxidoreductase chain 6 n=1 Tax=Pseudomegarcys japonica TaxID=2283285 RepID=A0A345F0Q2_9NEOP|nr:NADH dehydrogenase subunit 6 [Pseudomegarcys japonica]AXG21557.1 NADH dehydrogenase subunit 6 [Pseudomegarcys japonica]